MSLFESASRSPKSTVGDLVPVTPLEVIAMGVAPTIIAVQDWANEPGNHVETPEEDLTRSLLEQAFGISEEEIEAIAPSDSHAAIPLSKVIHAKRR